FGEVIRNTPTICLPDDHDIGQANLWGSGGKIAKTRHGPSGGYYMPAEYIHEVERAQTSHLPDPYDPTPIGNGIGVYYTALTWGGISFAIIEDRKFKTGPEEIGAKPAQRLNSKKAILLGKRQLDFLEDWVTDWKDAEIKSVLSQTIFASTTNYIGQRKRKMVFDFDSNGWPKAGRDKALAVIRKGYACMIGGDTHLATVIQHGINDWNDAGYSFCTPSIANFWLRWWAPDEPGQNHQAGQPNYTGEYFDGFKNKMTVHAVANPDKDPPGDKVDPNEKKLTTRAAGMGIVRYNKSDRTITFECWPRNVDLTDPASKQYPGWPITISQFDNCKFKRGFQLPNLKFEKADPVVTVKNALTQETITSVRVDGTNYQPEVPVAGKYNLEINFDGHAPIRLQGIKAKKQNAEKLEVGIPKKTTRRIQRPKIEKFVDTPTWVAPEIAAKEFKGFEFIGEFLGRDDALQISASKDQFYVSAFQGGLPGSGWDGGKIKHQWLNFEDLKSKLDAYKKVDRSASTTGKSPAPNATVLFNGVDTKHWHNGAMSKRFLKAGTRTKAHFRDFYLYLEFLIPFKPEPPISHPHRGNSGVFALGAYEVQIADTFALNLDKTAWEAPGPLKPQNTWCGSVYGIQPPRLNMCLAPLTWQSLEIDFRAARFNNGKKTEPARMSVTQNGQLIHDNFELPRGTGGGPSGPRAEVEEGPIVLQNHNNPNLFRNIWIVEK
ncbi:MAG: DUF1080 domain-containing protein, partial [Planctomycetota bacterium]